MAAPEHDGRTDLERPPPFYSNEEAADFLRLSPRTLEKYRVRGGGPPFRKLGRRVVYALSDYSQQVIFTGACARIPT